MSILCCPSCGQTAPRNRGVIPSSDQFAGQILSAPIHGGNLFECQECFLQFRYPLMPQEEIDRLYRMAPALHWTGDIASRTDFSLAVKWIKSLINKGKVLDVGCCRGDFLSLLGMDYQIFGIEINSSAADTATKRGVKLIGTDFSNLANHSSQFDVITAFDVIEHVADPLALINAIKDALRPNGIVILSTGNTMARSWRLMGSRYYYCNNPEHISFINSTWVRIAAEKLSLKCEILELFAHSQPSSLVKFSQFIRNLSYWFSPTLSCWMYTLVKSGDSRIARSITQIPPGWASAQDHFIFLLRKQQP